MDSKVSCKRRNYFIKRELQGKYVFNAFLLSVAAILLLAFLMGVFSANTMTISYENSDLKLGSTPVMMAKSFLTANWITLMFGGGLLVWLAIRFTHRVAGPIYRIELELDQMIKGDLRGRIHLRPNDDVKEMANLVNQFKDLLEKRLQRVNDITAEMERNTQDLTQSPEERLNKNLVLAHEISSELEFFKLSDE